MDVTSISALILPAVQLAMQQPSVGTELINAGMLLTAIGALSSAVTFLFMRLTRGSDLTISELKKMHESTVVELRNTANATITELKATHIELVTSKDETIHGLEAAIDRLQNRSEELMAMVGAKDKFSLDLATSVVESNKQTISKLSDLIASQTEAIDRMSRESGQQHSEIIAVLQVISQTLAGSRARNGHVDES